MKLADYSQNDTLECFLFSSWSPLEGGAESVRSLVAAFAAAADLAPTKATVEESTLKFDPTKVVGRILKEESGGVSVTLSRDEEPEVDYMLTFATNPPGFIMWAICPLMWFEGRRDGVERFVALVGDVAESTKASYAFAHSRTGMTGDENPLRGDPNAPIELYEAYWLNLIGPELADRLGRRRVDTAPAVLRKKLAYGGSLLLTSKDPTALTSKEAQRARALLMAHLEPGEEKASVERQRQRAAAAEPAEADWDPDMAPVFERIVKNALLGERPNLIRVFNDFRATEPDEFVSAEDLEPPDVEDVDAAVETLEGDWAEKLVMALHAKLPSLLGDPEEALADLDYLFFDEAYAETMEKDYIRTELVYMVGAFLGKALVHQLGGEWLPRRKLMESQVLVGDRAWLPFKRGQRFLKSKQSALTHSLTQFFRAAERHRRAGSPE
jgi:hypothetical protein